MVTRILPKCASSWPVFKHKIPNKITEKEAFNLKQGNNETFKQLDVHLTKVWIPPGPAGEL